jgi:hypothetical protein
VGAAVAACALVAVALRRARRPGLGVVGALVGVLIAVLVGYHAQRAFGRDRYRDTAERLQAAYGWARGVRSAPVAFTGMITGFPLYGPDLSNRVQFVGHHGPHEAFSVITTCREWRQAVDAGRFRYVVTAPGIASDPIPPATAWTKADPVAHQIVDQGGVAVFTLTGPLDPNSCPSP